MYPDGRCDTDEEQALVKELNKYARNYRLYNEGELFSITNWTKPLDNKMLMGGFFN